MSKVPIDHLFESGRAAFKFDGAWEVNTIYTSYPDVNLGVASYMVVGNKTEDGIPISVWLGKNGPV